MNAAKRAGSGVVSCQDAFILPAPATAIRQRFSTTTRSRWHKTSVRSCLTTTGAANGRRQADRIAALEAEVARLRQILVDAVEIINDQMPGEYPDWEIYARAALQENPDAG